MGWLNATYLVWAKKTKRIKFAMKGRLLFLVGLTILVLSSLLKSVVDAVQINSRGVQRLRGHQFVSEATSLTKIVGPGMEPQVSSCGGVGSA